jgi:hypothetical protein
MWIIRGVPEVFEQIFLEFKREIQRLNFFFFHDFRFGGRLGR